MAIFRRRAAPTEIVHAAASRFQSSQPGITSWHDFSAGAHYDPDRVAFGPLVGVDEHLLDPGAAFAEHAHRGVEILSWVLDGRLRHEDDAAQVEVLGPGTVLHQRAGSGIRHTEANASDAEQLRFIQLTVLGDADIEPRCTLAKPPLLLAGIGVFAVLDGRTELEVRSAYLHVTRGTFNLTSAFLEPGDSVALGKAMSVHGNGELLALALSAGEC